MLKIAQTIVILMGMHTVACAQAPEDTPDDLQLSEDVRALLQAEMIEIAGASQAVVMSLVMGDWQSIQRTSEQIRASYVMEKNLSEPQKQELAAKLPDRFKRLDAEFHARAQRLGSAAESGDREMVAFHYYRMLETCATCHAAFAQSRFPGFSSEAHEVHRH